MKPQPIHRRRLAGLTLLELLTCLTILAVSTGIALPHASKALAQQRIQQQMLLLHTQLAMARSTAITRSTAISLCPTNDGVLCSAKADWGTGRLMYLDHGKSAQPRFASDILLTSTAATLPDGTTIRTTHARRRIRFQADGRSAGSNATFHFCHAGQLRGKVVVNNMGRTRSERPRRPIPCP